ncbi:MAG: DUF3014 domain-containing protein [Halioglobus sp.]
MRANAEDQLRLDPRDSKFPGLTLLLAIAALLGLLLLWFWSGDEEVVAVEPVVVPAHTPDLPAAPDIPRAAAPEPARVVVPDVEAAVEQPLPSEKESDDLLRAEVAAVGADERLSGLVAREHPLEVSAALIEGMGRGVILRKILPADPPKEAFSVMGQGEEIYMDTAGYQRYDSYANSISSLDSAALVAGFHRLRPLYERAYEQLGLDSNDFDNAIVRALDLVLSTPEIEGPVPLQQKSVMYLYADPELEQLPELQKQLLRMGPENIRRIKVQAQILRNGLLQP